MKITHIETLTIEPNLCIVRVATDSGAEGLGQAAAFRAGITTALVHDLIAPIFLGQNPWDLQRLLRKVQAKHYKFRGSFQYRAMGGVEAAVWDLLGQLTGQPVYRLLGGAERRRIPMYASSLSRKVTPEQEAERMLGLVRQHGFKCVKIKVGERMGRDEDAAPGRTERIIPLMREALGPDIDISVDANSGFTPHHAIRIGRLLERYDYFHFEEPCPWEQYDSTKQVADALDIPVAGGEQDTDLHKFERMIRERAVDIVQLDLGYIGGVSRARRVAEMAELAGIPCTPHCPNHTLSALITLHLVAAMSACHHYQEWRADDNQPWAKDLYLGLPEIEDGHISLSEAPGWGVQLHPRVKQDALSRVSRCD